MSNRTTALLLFTLGFGGFLFTRNSTLIPSVPFAILVAPVFVLRFIRTQPPFQGILFTLLGFLISFNVALWGLFHFDDNSLMTLFSLTRSSLLAVIWWLPFMIDRWLYPKLKGRGTLSTLCFPTIFTAIFFLSSLEGPFDDGGGTISSFSYGSIVFLQAHSLFGAWTYVFLYSWLYALVNLLWESDFAWQEMRKPSVLYLSVLLAIISFGMIKTAVWSSSGRETVKVAAAVLRPPEGNASGMESIFNERVTSPIEATLINTRTLTSQAADHGAKIVTFQEFAMTIDEQDRAYVVQQYADIARDNGVYLSITYAYFDQDQKGENKHLFIAPEGEILLDYSKRFLLGFGPFGESAVFKKGPEVIQSVSTPFGTIGLSICRDLAFPSYVRQAARSEVDIMLSPAYDWPKSTEPWYLLSTIENGFSLVRPTHNGYSYAADYNGQVLAFMDAEQAEGGLMYAEVPVDGIKTLYPKVGNVLGWVCVIGLFLLALYKKKKVTKYEMA